MNNLEKESSLTYYGWIVVAMALLANFIAFGLVNTFTVFFKPVAAEFGWSRAMTAGAFSAYAITHDIFAPLTGWITDKWGPKIATALGGLCLGGSMILMGHIMSIRELYIYYALIFGMGIAAVYGPMMATVSRWFSLKRGFAIGLTTTGLGLGSLVLSPLVAWLISCYGWRTAYIFIGFIAFAFFIPITILIKQALKESLEREEEKESIRDFFFSEALRTKVFWILGFDWFFTALALYAILVHVVPLFTDKEVSLTMAGFLAGLIGGGSLIGRIVGGFLSDKLGRKSVLLTGQTFLLISLIWILFSKETWMFSIFAIIFGIGLGGVGCVIAAFPADYFGLKATGTIFGFIMIFAGMGVAIGSFIGGYIFDKTHSYDFMIMMCIVSMIIALILGSFLKNPAERS